MPSEVEPLLHSCPNCAALLDVSEQDPFSEIQCPSCGTQMRVRTRFDHFELIEAIASGGMGTVYKARDVNLNRVVALKLLRKEFSVDQEYIEKLETEAKITASVSHPNVVKVFSFGCDGGQYYIAMELVDKGSLDDLMNLQGRIAEVQVLEIGMQVAQGLRAAFQAGLIHRDVKPGNILFADAHTSKIVDFGLAMPLEQARESEEEIWGTPYYVAPEKLNHDPEDFRSDIYSLGGTLFHALAGRPPFEAVNASLVALKHLKSQVVSLQAFAPDISSPTAYVINRTLAKNPDDRYQSYDELVEHLQYARTQLLEKSGKPREPKARVVVEGDEQQKMLGFILMGAIAFVVVIGILLFVFKDKINASRQSVAELQRARRQKALGNVEQVYLDARRQIFDGESESAIPALKSLENRPNIPEILKGWITLHEGIAAFLSDLSWEGQEAFTRLQSIKLYSEKPEEREIANFFAEVARRVVANTAVHPSIIREYSTPGVEPLGLFVLALREWESNRYESAGALFQGFLTSNPQGKWAWINEYKRFAKEYLADFNTYKEIGIELKNANTPEKRIAAIPKIAAVRGKLHLSGKLPEYLSNYERSFQNSLPRGPANDGMKISIYSLRDRSMALVRDFMPEQAQAMVKSAVVIPADEKEKAAILKRVTYCAQFKQQLLADLNSTGYSAAPLVRKNGSQIIGKAGKATATHIEVQTGGGKVAVAWVELSPDTVLKIATSFIKSPNSPSGADVEKVWLSGVYAALNGAQAEGMARLMRAAEVKKEYARDLVLFDAPVR